MPPTDKPVSLIAAIKDFFEADGGPKLGLKEMQALSPEDRAYFKGHLERAGYQIATPAA